MQNIPHGLTEFLSEIVLTQSKLNARFVEFEVPHQHIIVWNLVCVVSTASHFII